MAIADERAEQAVRWLAEQGGQGTSAGMGAALGWNAARRAEVVQAGRAAGWIERYGNGRLRLTPVGWAAAGAGGLGSGGEVLDRVLGAVWPTWAAPHAAYCRLIVSAVVAKHHLWEERPDGHLGFASIGPPGSGKTVVHQIVCHLLGLDWRRHLVQLDEETPGSLYGRRERGEDGWGVEPSAIASLPLVLFDEVDKAPTAARTRIWRYLRGQGAVWVEGREQELRPVAMVAGNTAAGAAPWALLPQGAARRSVLLDPGYLAGRERELGRHLGEVMPALRPQDRMGLDRLAVSGSRLDAEARGLLGSVDRLVLDALGPVPRQGLELAALGRAALLGDGDQMRAVLETCADYLAVTATTAGWVRPEWPSLVGAVADHLGRSGHTPSGGGGVVAVLEEVEEAQGQARARARQTIVEEEAESDRLVYDRAQLVQGLDQVRRELDGRRISGWPAEWQRRAVGARQVLDRIRAQAAESRSRAALDAIEERAEPYVREAVELLEEAAAAQRHQAEGKQQAVQQRQLERQQDREQRAIWRSELDAAVSEAREWERCWRLQGAPRPGQPRPMAVLAGLLEYTPDPASEPPAGILARMGAALGAPVAPSGRWSTRTGVDLGPGTRQDCYALRAWGPAAQEVIWPLLAELHMRENWIRQAMGRAPRTGRPILPGRPRTRPTRRIPT